MENIYNQSIDNSKRNVVGSVVTGENKQQLFQSPTSPSSGVGCGDDQDDMKTEEIIDQMEDSTIETTTINPSTNVTSTATSTNNQPNFMINFGTSTNQVNLIN